MIELTEVQVLIGEDHGTSIYFTEADEYGNDTPKSIYVNENNIISFVEICGCDARKHPYWEQRDGLDVPREFMYTSLTMIGDIEITVMECADEIFRRLSRPQE